METTPSDDTKTSTKTTQPCSYCEQENHALSDCEARRVLRCVSEWAVLAIREGYEPAIKGALHEQGAWANLPVEIDHSALLKRLIQGKKPLEMAPPRSHSYPWYNLYENGEGNAYEVTVVERPLGEVERPIVIDQGVWMLLQELGANRYVAQWRDGHPKFLVEPHDAPEHAFMRYQLTRIDE